MDPAVDQLAARAQRGDSGAFAQLIAHFERSALAVAYSATGDSHLASDATQEAFLRAWQKLGTLREPGRFAPWLIGIVRNSALDQVRRRHDIGELVEDQPGREADEPSTRLGQMELRGRINAALAELDEMSRATVVLRYFEDLSSKQIAELLDLSPAAVDMRLSRARQALKEKLEPAGAI